MKIFLDGKFVDEAQAVTPIYEPGFLYAQGLFETMRADNKKIFRLDEHVRRIIQSAPLININLAYSREKLKDIINEALGLNNYFTAYARLTVWQSGQNEGGHGSNAAHTSVIVREYTPFLKQKYASGFSAIIAGICQNEKSILTNIKTSCRLHFLLAEREAKEKEADEALLLNTKGNIAEGARTNIFLIKDKTVFTPNKESGCLLGLARDTVLGIAAKEKIKLYEKEIKPDELFSADEAFLTNSLIGIMPLTYLNKQKIGKAHAGNLTALFIKKYEELREKG